MISERAVINIRRHKGTGASLGNSASGKPSQSPMATSCKMRRISRSSVVVLQEAWNCDREQGFSVLGSTVILIRIPQLSRQETHRLQVMKVKKRKPKAKVAKRPTATVHMIQKAQKPKRSAYGFLISSYYK
jgi:hypothetical protein